MTPQDELLHRLTQDRRAIGAELGGGQRIGRVLEVRSGLSDPHDGERTVAVVRFASGLRVVYKPRSVGLEAAFSRFVTWWNQRAGNLSLFAPRVLERGDHGWMEFVAHEACLDHEAACRYWGRAGTLIALADLLDATDLHHGNVIAHGEYPVLVDLETLLQPRRPGKERSLLDTSLVPAWIRGPDGGSYDVSGFGAITPQRYKGAAVPLRENVARVGTDILSAAEFADQIEAGFRRAGALLCERREELLTQLTMFRGLEVRVMLRHTETYRAAMEDGSALAAMAETERAALRRGDIPRFVASTESSFNALIARTRQLEPGRYEEQARLLRTAIALWHLGGVLASAGPRAAAVQQHHEDDIEEGGADEEKQDEPAQARGALP